MPIEMENEFTFEGIEKEIYIGNQTEIRKSFTLVLVKL
jgi:hypothetical protein